MTYSVKEIYLTVQGEGAQTGIAAVFLRFAGCNLWSGLTKDRASAVCKFCDTDFIGTNGPNGGKFKTAADLVTAAAKHWPSIGEAQRGQPWVICTGGEPLLQLDTALIDAFHAVGFKVAVETNGTIKAPTGLDWICVSPKANAELVQTSGHELKLVYPQDENKPEDFAHLDFEHFCLQPRDDSYMGIKKAAHEKAAFDYCLGNPQWRLSVQTHKYLGVP
ncbi:7-carboxy-7-deazaguanine synthase [Hellea balneolensis]|uniref:7-carboxy-7-deazaguanine synthase n=1 Tax=Hellea balneolensis TaxID=287478 RepID=UPI0004236E49|nr:7-carboxy-7-deazaguanine synthase [Hellea balneolensis]